MSVHTIVYTNRFDAIGYNLYERSPGFPETYCAAIKSICENLQVGYLSEPAVRYAPLDKRSGKYLLSVLLWVPPTLPVQTSFNFDDPNGSAQALASMDRAHYAVVNFLMDRVDANAFFRLPYARCHDILATEAKQMLDTKRLPDPEYFTQQLADAVNSRSASREPARDPNAYTQVIGSGAARIFPDSGAAASQGLQESTLPKEWLLMSALYGTADHIKRQVFAGSSHSTIREVQALQELLPYELRKDMTFHTGICSVKNSGGVSLNLCRLSIYDGINFTGGPSTQRFMFRDSQKVSQSEDEFLSSCQTIVEVIRSLTPNMRALVHSLISSWEDFTSLQGLKQPYNPLPELLAKFNRQDVQKALAHLPEPLSNVDRMQLENAGIRVSAGSSFQSAMHQTAPAKGAKNPKQSGRKKAEPQETPAGPTYGEGMEEEQGEAAQEQEYRFNSYAEAFGPLIGYGVMLLVGIAGFVLLLSSRFDISMVKLLEHTDIIVELEAAVGLLEILATAVCTALLMFAAPRLYRHLKPPKTSGGQTET